MKHESTPVCIACAKFIHTTNELVLTHVYAELCFIILILICFTLHRILTNLLYCFEGWYNVDNQRLYVARRCLLLYPKCFIINVNHYLYKCVVVLILCFMAPKYSSGISWYACTWELEFVLKCFNWKLFLMF